MSSDRRRSPRIKPFVARCTLRVGPRSLPGYLTDLSLEGAQVSAAGTPPAAGSTLAVEVRLAPGAAHSRLPARVLWIRTRESGGFSAGLSFDELGEAEQHALQAVVEEFQRRAAELA
jgi:hypothetical protein